MSEAAVVFGASPVTPIKSAKTTYKSEQYVNIALPAINNHGEVSQSKLGNGIGLSMSKATEAKIITARNAAKAAGREDEFVEWFRNQIIIEFRNGDGSDASTVTVPSFG